MAKEVSDCLYEEGGQDNQRRVQWNGRLELCKDCYLSMKMVRQEVLQRVPMSQELILLKKVGNNQGQQ